MAVYIYRITYGGVCEVWVESDGRTITKVLAATADHLSGAEIQDLPRPTYVEAKLMTGSGRPHACRAEPHCVCGENAWYHRDVDEAGVRAAAECGMDNCPCERYERCYEYARKSSLPCELSV